MMTMMINQCIRRFKL